MHETTVNRGDNFILVKAIQFERNHVGEVVLSKFLTGRVWYARAILTPGRCPSLATPRHPVSKGKDHPVSLSARRSLCPSSPPLSVVGGVTVRPLTGTWGVDIQAPITQ